MQRRIFPRALVQALALVTLLVTAWPAGADETATAATTTFDRFFLDATLRVDLYHTGNAEHEVLAIDRLFRQGSWAGSLTRLLDPFGYGSYQVSAYDAATGTRLFSRGYDTYFGEYRTTGLAAAGRSRTFHETVLLPFPRQPLRLVFERIARDGSRQQLLEETIDPDAVGIATEALADDVQIIEQQVCGDPHRCLDLVMVGEGYTEAEADRFRQDLARLSAVLLGQEPYAGLSDRISIRGVLQPSQESGCDEPGRGIYRRTSVGASFNALGSPRYLLIEDHRALRDLAAHVPYDALVVVVNHDRYGGGGIYNLYATVTARNQWSPYVLVHELGHSFAGLADEYYTSLVAYSDFYPKGIEPKEANITALLDPAQLKWRDLVSEQTPLPTPWEKEAYDTMDSAYQRQRQALYEQIATASRSGAGQAEIDRLNAEQEELSRTNGERALAFLQASKAAGTVGAFEGAGYCATGLYRPAVNCIMFSKGLQPFCPVCSRAISAMINHSIDRGAE